ncbi:type II toxin-antitoxin system VapC family toxin, partial [Candidatus Woesearchaeota archaeon]|nr:type II toxin-antitoxin system VapC family toxin [Candidatus Woesearchaeota archaeon]
MHFRLKYKKENLSYADCIGYALAEMMRIKFLTGDEKFRNKENVEFVK